MAIYALGQLEPVIDASAYVHPDAVIIGAVTIGAASSVWPCAVLRGDDGEITIGARSSIQDGAVLHTTPVAFTTVGNDCTVGHLAHLEGCTVADGSLIGSNSVVLHNVTIGSGSLVAASAVVLADTDVPDGALAYGVPARIREGAANAQLLMLSAQSYVDRAGRFARDLRRID